MKSIFEYLDYREYLKDYYEEQKLRRPLHFSYRYLAMRIGIDASYLARTMAKKKHLSVDLAPKLSSFFKLSARESHYFSLTMFYSRAKNEGDKRYFLEQLSSSRLSSIESFDLQKQQLLYNWYVLVVWELLTFVRIPDDPDIVMRWIVPAITRQQAMEALSLLKKYDFVELQEDGTLKSLNKTLFMNTSEKVAVVENMKKQVTGLALHALSRFPEQEQISNYALASLSDKSMAILRKRIDSLIKKIFKLAQCDQSDRRVYHFAFHGFPASIDEKER